MDTSRQKIRGGGTRPPTQTRYSLSSIHSQAGAKSYVRKVLASLPLYRSLDDEVANFILQEVLFYHPRYEEKIGVGVVSLRLEQNRHRNGNMLVLVRADGSSDDFSWYKCLEKRYATDARRPESLDNLDSALRHTVYPDIAAFRAERTHNGLCWCVDTQAWESKSHVDHADPFFCEIVDMFLAEKKLRREDIKVVPLERGGHRLESQELADAWRRFHKKHAKLQMLSAHGNLSKGGPRNRTARTRSRTLEDSGKIIGAHFAHAPKSRSRILEGR